MIEEKEQAVAHQTYIKPSIVTKLRKKRSLWSEREKMLHARDPTLYPSKSVMIKRAIYDSLGEDWQE